MKDIVDNNFELIATWSCPEEATSSHALPDGHAAPGGFVCLGAHRDAIRDRVLRRPDGRLPRARPTRLSTLA